MGQVPRRDSMLWQLLAQRLRLLVAVFIAAPIALGPAYTPVLEALGLGVEHSCACGMVRGECRCPECKMEELAHKEAKKPHDFATLRTDCAEDDASVVSLEEVAIAPARAGVLMEVRISTAALVTPLAPRDLLPRDRDRPPLPPPRA